MTDPNLSSRDRAHLRSLAHHLEPVVRLGNEGLTPAIIEATSVALEEHELIKVRFGPGFAGDRRPAAGELAAATRADLVQLIGRVAVLYRPPTEPPADDAVSGAESGPSAGRVRGAPKITLPGSRATKRSG